MEVGTNGDTGVWLLYEVYIWSLFTTKAEYNHTKQIKKENKIVRSYMNVNCWTNQTILSVIVTEYTDLYTISM